MSILESDRVDVAASTVPGPSVPPPSARTLINHIPIPQNRDRKLQRLERTHGHEFALVKDKQLQVARIALDTVKVFQDYVGSDGKLSSSSRLDEAGNPRIDKHGDPISRSGSFIGVTRQITRLLGGSVIEAEKTGNTVLMAKHILALTLIDPILQNTMQKNLPRARGWGALWLEVKKIGSVRTDVPD